MLSLSAVEKERRQSTLWCSILYVILTLLVLLFTNRGSTSARLIGCYVLLFAALLLPLDDLLLLIVEVIPSGNIYMISESHTVMPYLIMIYIIKSLPRVGCRLSPDVVYPTIWAGLLFIISFITATVNEMRVNLLLPFYMHLVFIIIALNINHINNENTYNRLAIGYIVGTLLVCVGTTLFPEVSRTLSNISVYSTSNPGFASTWDFGRSLCISIAFVVVFYLKTKKWIILDVFLVLILMYYLILCGRFSMLLGLAGLIACIPFVAFQSKSPKQRVLYFFLLVGAMIIVTYLLYVIVYPYMVALRGETAGAHGRFEVWTTYFRYLDSNPLVFLFGVGGGTIASIAEKLKTATAHNIMLEKIVEVGVIGIVLFVMFFISLYRNKTINPSRNINILPLVTFLGTALTQGTTGSVAFMLLLAMCASERFDKAELINSSLIYNNSRYY